MESIPGEMLQFTVFTLSSKHGQEVISQGLVAVTLNKTGKRKKQQRNTIERIIRAV